MIGRLVSRSSWRLASPVALWGKMPCRGDFIRRNLPFEQEEALERWVGQKRGLLSPQDSPPARQVTNGLPWNSLESPARRPPAFDSLAFGYPGQPWCFALSPRRLPGPADRYRIGVWMNSRDKVGREYPLVMIQTVARRWARQYFALHTECPCEWLFNAARLIAHSIHAQEDGDDRPAGPAEKEDGEPDPVSRLMARLNALWSLYAPDWRHSLGKRIALPGYEARWIRELIDPPGPDDPVRHLEGVRFLPWADWPRCLLDSSEKGYFWQQNLNGRFIGALCA
jgi:type VI secretion system protein ImpM